MAYIAVELEVESCRKSHTKLSGALRHGVNIAPLDRAQVTHGQLLCCRFLINATAGTRSDKPAARPRPKAEASQHYVDFLARPSQYFGHSYVQVGTIDRNGTTRPAATAGFYPKSTKSVFGAPAVVTATAADLKSAPSVRYRVAISERTYCKTTALIKELPRSFQRYDLIGRNCNHLMGRVAGRIGLAGPWRIRRSRRKLREVDAICKRRPDTRLVEVTGARELFAPAPVVVGSRKCLTHPTRGVN